MLEDESKQNNIPNQIESNNSGDNFKPSTQMGKGHLAEYELYDKDSGDHIGSVVIRESWDGKKYVDVYNGNRKDKYDHDHTWSAIGRDTLDSEMGYHGFRQRN